MSKMMKRMMIIFLVIIMALGTVATANAINMANFTDVQGHWGYDAIDWVVRNNYMVGVSSTEFNPDGTITRAQITQILYNMAGRPDATGFTNPYKDVPEDAWYKNAAVWAYKKGVTGNNIYSYFNPNECVPREQIALMFELYALKVDTVNKKAKFELDDKYMSKFEDLSAIGNDIFYKALNWAVQYSLIQGVSKTEIAPEAYTTRAMMAQLIKNYYDHREDEGSGDPPVEVTDPLVEETDPSAVVTDPPPVRTDPPVVVTDPPVVVTDPPVVVTDPPVVVTDPPVVVTNPPVVVTDPPVVVTDPPVVVTDPPVESQKPKPSKPPEGNDGDTPTETDAPVETQKPKPSKPPEGNDGDTPTETDAPVETQKPKPSKPPEGNDGDTPTT